MKMPVHSVPITEYLRKPMVMTTTGGMSVTQPSWKLLWTVFWMASRISRLPMPPSVP